MKFLSSLLEIVVSSEETSSNSIADSFDDHLVLATCVLLIEVAKADDEFDAEFIFKMSDKNCANQLLQNIPPSTVTIFGFKQSFFMEGC